MTVSGDAHLAAEGLQAERTALAWSRTALGLLGNGALLLLRSYHSGRPLPTIVLATLAAAAAAAVALAARTRNRELLSTRGANPAPVGRRLLLLVVVVVGLAILTSIDIALQ